MISDFHDSSHFPDIFIQEDCGIDDTREQKRIPTLDDLKEKLQDVFLEAYQEEDIDKFEITNVEALKESCTNQVTLEDGTVIELPNIEKTESDDNGKVYIKDGKLESNETYELNGHVYTTDDEGRIIKCVAKPQYSPENPRDIDAQLQVGGEDRRPKDQGGHIVGRDLGGDGGTGNLVAMDSKINQSDYKRMENDVKTALDEGKNITTITDINYTGKSQRPDIITTTVVADDVKTIYKFDNNIDGSLLKDVPSSGKDVVNAELRDTNGQISSIKQEYNSKGELVETTVSVTYTDEEGNNHRTKVFIDGE